MANPKVEAAKRQMLATVEADKPLQNRDFVSTGLTLIDLGAYGRISCGMAKGKIYRVAGRSSAGKTFLCRTILAEAARNPMFDKHQLIYDDIERGALMDTTKFFGELLAKRLVPPARMAKSKEPVYSRTIGDLYSRLRARLEAGRPFIWIPDSMDALLGNTETKMGDGKAKVNSQELRKLVDGLEKTGSILIMVSQAHVDMKSMFGGDLAAGGRALEYYSTLDIWLRKCKPVKVDYKGVKMPVGTIISARIQKNRLSGQDRTVYFPFSPEFGIDNIGANIDFLCKFKHWPREKGIITATELDFQDTRTKLIRKIEEEGLERELEIIVGKEWHSIQRAITPERKPRYE